MERSEPPSIVLALGGNALQNPAGDDSVESDFERTKVSADRIAALVAEGLAKPVITHGNGPQVGNHLLRSELGHTHGGLPPLPLDVCVADTQGGMGYMLQQCLTNSFGSAGIPAVVVSVVTQVVVDPLDPAFSIPSKPVGELIAADKVEDLEARGWHLVEDVHRGGWRRVVASPDPKEIIEAEAIRAMVRDGAVVIAAGGGGIPVAHGEDGMLKGVPAVVDKDLASALLAVDLGVEMFVIATDVDRAYLHYGHDDQKGLDVVSVADAREAMRNGEFPSGSMGPKVEAACRFAAGTGRPALITSLEACANALAGEGGTRVVP